MRHAEKVAQPLRKARFAKRQQQGAAGIARIAYVIPAREFRYQPAFHRAEGEPTRSRRGRHRIVVFEQPAHLGGGKIGIEQKARFPVNILFPSALAQRRTVSGRAPVLPDNRARQRLQRVTVPGDHRLALVGDADRGNAFRAAVAQHPARAIEARLPDFLRIVLHPAGPWKVLRDLRLRAAAKHAVAPEQHRAGGCGARVDDQNMLAQTSPLPERAA